MTKTAQWYIIQLWNIVRVRRLTLADTLRLPQDKPASAAMQWASGTGKRRRGRPAGDKHFRKIYKRYDSAGVVFV